MNIDFAKAREIFLAAVEKGNAKDRGEFLDQACGADQGMRCHVDALLDAHRQSGAFLEQGALAEATIDQPPDERPGTQIGPYKLLQQVGHGGMGVVYMAEQTAPVNRRVALKIIKPGMDSRQVIARFEAERQSLAMMDHPNIAKVLDAGQTDSGMPYFVMEMVQGVPLTQYCDDQRLTPTQRLELFVPVCLAVQHAHQKGIIHRDIKPSNILVALYDDQPVPKVIDFGVAKAVNQRLTEKTMFTRYGQVVGTLEYMSPEQAKLNQLDIDTRSDIYSLGVLLYELLTGSTPIEQERLRLVAFDELLRVIREEEPPKPSTRLSSNATLAILADNRNTEPRKLVGLVRGDLDWIVMKAVAKQRGDRYQTADAMAADVRRHLHDEPIEARRPSAFGRVVRVVRRNRVPTLLTALVLLAGTVAAALGLKLYADGLKRREEMRARRTIPTIKRLVNRGNVVEAFRLAKGVQEVLLDDPSFRELWNSFTVTVTFDIRPPGTRVLVRDWNGQDDEWMQLGKTPLEDLVLPKGDLRFRYVKDRFITREFQRKFPDFLAADGTYVMREDWGVPREMVFIDGTRTENSNRPWDSLLNMRPVKLGEFLIDRYEVSNGQFKEFVDAGGYREPKFWEHLQFIRDGNTLSFEDAMECFQDTSSRQRGPAGWRNGTYPAGEQDYPVRGVSWFEAAAYAKFAGKSLPTIHHWQWAADTDQPEKRIALSNFGKKGPAARGEYRGIGRFDVYDLAGNVKEWCWNANSEGHRCLRGAAWNDSGFLSLSIDVASPWDRSETHGFRCVRYLSDGTAEPATLEPWQRNTWDPATRERIPLETLLAGHPFDYDKDSLPPLVADRIAPKRLPYGIRHEVVRIHAAYNEEQFDVHFFLPPADQEQYETILWIPDNAAWFEKPFSAVENADWDIISRLVQTGRMVCYPIHQGTYERSKGGFFSPQFRDTVIAAAKDIARTVEYLLLERHDVRKDRLVYMGYGAGAIGAPRILVTIEGFQAGILVAGGYPPALARPEWEVISPFHYTPHVKVPVLMITGEFDTRIPYGQLQVPCFDDLGDAELLKRHIPLKCGHDPPPEDIVHETDKWLRSVLGPSDSSVPSSAQ